MKLIIPMICCSLALLPSLARFPTSEPEAEFDVLQLLPEIPDGSDWTWADPPTLYRTENLFEYLNGGAPQYLSYGFVSLVNARYAYQGRDLNSVTLDIFDMGSQLGAYGIYSSGRPREISKRSWGAEGYRSGTVAAAWKGRIYVHGSADEDTPPLIEKLEMLMDQAAAVIPGESNLPSELALLPVTRFIAGSDRYIGKNLLGHSFLPGGFLAHYDLDGSEGLLFVSDLRTEAGAGRAFDLFYSFEEVRGKILERGRMGDASFWVEDPGLGFGVVIRRRTYVGGLWGIENPRIAENILAELDSNLSVAVATE